MATKKPQSKTTRTYTAKNRTGGFRFRWWMALVLVGIIAIVGIVVIRFSNASSPNDVAIPPEPTYWLGDSLSVGLGFGGQLGTKLRKLGYYPININADPGRSIRGRGFGTKQSGLEAIETDKAVVQNAKLIVIFLGTNGEADFAGAQAELLAKIKTINPTAKVVWVDVAAVGKPDNTKFRDLATATNKAIYANSNTLAMPYGIISQFNFIWGNKASPLSLASQVLPDPGKLLGADGTHYDNAGYYKLADYLISSIMNGNIVGPGLQPASTVAGETSVVLPLTDTAYSLSQPGNTTRTSACAIQSGFKRDASFRACIITANTPLTITSANFAQYTNSTALKVCVTAFSSDQQPLQAVLKSNGTTKATVPLTFGAQGIAKIIACGNTTAPAGAFNDVTISSPSRILMTRLTIKAQ